MYYICDYVLRDHQSINKYVSVDWKLGNVCGVLFLYPSYCLAYFHSLSLQCEWGRMRKSRGNGDDQGVNIANFANIPRGFYEIFEFAITSINLLSI